MKVKYELAQMFEADPQWSTKKILEYADTRGQLDNQALIKIIALLLAKMEVLEAEIATLTQVVSEMSKELAEINRVSHTDINNDVNRTTQKKK